MPSQLGGSEKCLDNLFDLENLNQDLFKQYDSRSEKLVLYSISKIEKTDNYVAKVSVHEVKDFDFDKVLNYRFFYDENLQLILIATDVDNIDFFEKLKYISLKDESLKYTAHKKNNDFKTNESTVQYLLFNENEIRVYGIYQNYFLPDLGQAYYFNKPYFGKYQLFRRYDCL
ncbi:MAG: hypothetical protein H6604_08200 [Flavobacteriales bacterium]|nr:hypothetical protein [Flavobacteriales bacterium]